MKTSEVHADLIGKSYADIIEKLEIEDDQGDCCGWTSIDPTGSIPDDVSKDSLRLAGCTQIDYCDDESDSERRVLNFLFTDNQGNQVILGYDLQAGSGSGWAYGAYVQLKLDNKILVEASW